MRSLRLSCAPRRWCWAVEAQALRPVPPGALTTSPSCEPLTSTSTRRPCHEARPEHRIDQQQRDMHRLAIARACCGGAVCEHSQRQLRTAKRQGRRHALRLACRQNTVALRLPKCRAYVERVGESPIQGPNAIACGP